MKNAAVMLLVMASAAAPLRAVQSHGWGDAHPVPLVG